MKSKITPELISKCEEYAINGLNNLQIMEAVDISHTTFYATDEILATVRAARNKLREEVAKSLMDKVSLGDTTAAIYLSKRLNVFDYGIDIPKITNAQEALEALTMLSRAEAEGRIDESKSKRLEGIINSFIKGYEITDLEERIKALEESNGK